MKITMKKILVSLSLLFAGVSLSSCGFPGLTGGSESTIKIVAQSTTESQIIGSMLQQLIEHESDNQVELINNLGSGTLSFNALKNGDADISSARYTGTDLSAVLNKPVEKDTVKANKIVKDGFENRFQMKWFDSLGFADTYAFMVTKETAKKYHLNTVSDLRRIESKLTVGVDANWISRVGDGYDGFQKEYNIKFGNIYPMQIGLVYSALAKGKMDVVLGYSTDGRIKSYDLKILKDDRHFFPPYSASLVANDSILKEHPELTPLIDRLKNKINLSTMQSLNYKVDNDFYEPAVVAKQFLEEHHYFEKAGD